MKDHKLVTREVYFDIDKTTPQDFIGKINEIVNANKDLINPTFSSESDEYCCTYFIEGWYPLTESEIRKKQEKAAKEKARKQIQEARKRGSEEKELKRLYKKLVGKELDF